METETAEVKHFEASMSEGEIRMANLKKMDELNHQRKLEESLQLKEGEFEMRLVHFSFTENKDGRFTVSTYFEDTVATEVDGDLKKEKYQFNATVDSDTFNRILTDVKETKNFIGIKPKVATLQSIRRDFRQVEVAPKEIAPLSMVDGDGGVNDNKNH